MAKDHLIIHTKVDIYLSIKNVRAQTKNLAAYYCASWKIIDTLASIQIHQNLRPNLGCLYKYK